MIQETGIMSKQTEIQWGEVEVVKSSVLDWKEVKVEDIKADFAHALSTGPFGSAISSKYFLESGFPVIRGANLSQNVSERLSDDGLVFISPEKAQEFRRSVVRKGDLIFTCWGTINQVGLIDGKSKYEEYVISNKQMKLTPDLKKADPYFLYYLFSSPDYQSRILNNDIGSSVPGFNLGQLKKMEMLLPSISEQRAIAAVLSSLDEKIDLLHRQNATLEGLAETLFRQWFVEEAKEDWEETCLGEVISVKGGTTPSTKETDFWDGTINWTTPKDLSNHTSVYMLDTERKITEKGLAKIGSGLLPLGTVLLSSRAPIGYLAITSIPVAINQGYIAILCDKGLSNYFMFLWCKTNLEEIKNNGNGSVFQEISKSVFKELKITLPPKEILDRFDEMIESSFEKIRNNQTQIQTLSTLRDTLLPKLMSGEVRVNFDNGKA